MKYKAAGLCSICNTEGETLEIPGGLEVCSGCVMTVARLRAGQPSPTPATRNHRGRNKSARSSECTDGTGISNGETTNVPTVKLWSGDREPLKAN